MKYLAIILLLFGLFVALQLLSDKPLTPAQVTKMQNENAHEWYKWHAQASGKNYQSFGAKGATCSAVDGVIVKVTIDSNNE